MGNVSKIRYYLFALYLELWNFEYQNQLIMFHRLEKRKHFLIYPLVRNKNADDKNDKHVLWNVKCDKIW